MKKKNICKYINNIKLKKKLLIINKLIIFLFLITFLLFYYKFYFFVEKNKIIRKYNFKKVKNYLNKCLKGKLNKEINFLNIIKNIDISVIIPVYNSQNTIKNCIISIQAQKKSELEIIIINDFSNDNSKAIIEEMQKKDSRIKIINNSKNMGTLYSRCIGVLLSKGKYIFPLDNDDMFLDQNLLSSIYNESYYFNYDIVGFKALRGNSYNSKISEMYDDEFHMHKNGLILYQPQLSHFSLLNKECHIWGKSIKTELYKTAVNSLGKKRYSIYVCLKEDKIIIFILFQFAKSFKFISKYGIYHLIHKKSASFNLSKNHLLFSQIYLLDIIYDFTKNNEKDKKYVISNALLIKKSFLSHILLNKENRKFLKKVLKKIITSHYINDDNKQLIKDNFKNLNLFK